MARRNKTDIPAKDQIIDLDPQPVDENEQPTDETEQPAEQSRPEFSLYVSYAVDGLKIDAVLLGGVREPSTVDEIGSIVRSIREMVAAEPTRAGEGSIVPIFWKQVAGCAGSK